MIFATRVMSGRVKNHLMALCGRACLGVLLLGTAGSCARSELSQQVDDAKAALQEQQTQLEVLRKTQGKSGATPVLPASQNWHLQELQKRLADGKVLEANLAAQKAELEQELQKLEAVRSDYLKNHGGSKS